MKITYKGNTYQELLDLTGDKGKTSFEVPARETELIDFIYQSGYVDEGDCDWHEDKLSFDIPSWCKFSPNSWEIDEDGWGEGEDKDYWDWKKVIIHAVEQSGGLYIPILSEPLSLEDLYKDKNYDGYEKILCDPSGVALSNVNRNNFPKIVIIGPEGGFSDSELNLARTFNWNIVTLGDRILRTETAAIVAQVLLRG